MATILTVKSSFLGYTVGQQITDPTVVANILANPDYEGLVIASGAPADSGGSSPVTPSATVLTSNHGSVTPDNTTIAITTGNVLYVIPSGSSSGSVVSALGFTPANAALIGVPSGIAQLDSTGRLPLSQLTASVVGALDYQGVWDASMNSPGLMSSVGTKGFYYKVSIAGNTPLDGIISWSVGDILAFNGTTWDKIGGNVGAQVTTFNTRTGAITLINTDVQGALGYTPYNASNPANYVNTTQAAAAAPVLSVNTRTGVITLVSSDIISALTFTPYNATNPSNYITLAQSVIGAPVKSFNTRTGSIVLTSSDIATALTYTPYNAANPAGYITLAQVPTAGNVTSVAGRIGVVTLSASDISGLAAVATSGSFTNLINRPTIATATSQLTNDAMFIPASGAPVQSVNAQTGNVVLSTSQLTNDAGFVTLLTAPVTSINGMGGNVVLPETPGTLVNLAVSSLTNDLGYIASSVLPFTNISACLVTVNGVTQTLAQWFAQLIQTTGHILNSTGGSIIMTSGQLLAF